MNTQQPEWKTRPADLFFDTLTDLREAVAAKRASSYERPARAEMLTLRADAGDLTVYDKRNPTGGARLSHYAFTQICARAKAPSGFLRTMPATLAAQVLGWAMENTPETGESKLLLAKEPGSPLPRLRALTSGGYGRIWDLDVADAVMQLSEQGSPWSLSRAGLSDRGLFIFLINAAQKIQLPGEDKPEWRPGVYIQNGETGKDVFGVSTFLYNPTKDIRLMLPESKGLRIRHNRRAPLRFIAEAVPKLQAQLTTNVAAETRIIEQARAKVIAQSAAGAKAWLQRRGFPLDTASSVEATLGRDQATLWAVEQALLDAARNAPYMDERIDIERKASKLFTA